MKKSIHSITLSFEDFRLLLEKHGLIIPEDSDLAPLLSINPATDATALEEKGLLRAEPIWLDVLQAICDPAYQVDTVTFMAQSTLSTSYFSGKNHEILVGCCPDNGKVHITFPWTPNELIQKEMQLFGVGRGSMDRPQKKYTFSPDGLFLFAAAIDAIRELLLASMAQRVIISDYKLSVTDLDKLFVASLNDPNIDTRWIVSLLRIAAPAIYEPERKTLNHDALDELLKQGLIHVEGTHWAAQPDLIEIAHDLFIPIPALMIQAQTFQNSTLHTAKRTLNFNGRSGLSTLNFIMTDDTVEATFHTVSREEFWLNLTGAVTPPVVDKAPAGKQEETGSKFCTSCGSPLEQGVKFCTKCGQAIKTKAKD